MQTPIRCCVGDAAPGLGLHLLHMTEGPFSHDAGHILKAIFDYINCFIDSVWYISSFNILFVPYEHVGFLLSTANPSILLLFVANVLLLVVLLTYFIYLFQLLWAFLV